MVVASVAAVLFRFFPLAVQAKPSSVLLTGRVEHSRILSPLRQELATGHDFNPAHLLAPGADNRWFPIPDWLAGTWRQERQTAVFQHDIRTGRRSNKPETVIARAQERWGEQEDRQGRIWQFVHTGQLTHVVGEKLINYGFVRAVEPLTVSQRQVDVRVELQSFLVEKAGGKILASRQAEEIVSYRPRAHGLIRVSGTRRLFDQAGRPESTSRIVYLARRVKEFARVDTMAGRSLKEMFARFLKQTGRSALVPQ